jgi:hypothetical protein
MTNPFRYFGVITLIPVLGLAACGQRRLNVMQTPEQTFLTVGYSAERSQSIFRADNEAQEFCQRRKETVVYLKQDTIYQGQYDENINSAARTAGRVAGAFGRPDVATAGRSLSSPTDYKTTFEFLCK